MLTCVQARLLIQYGASPGTSRKGTPELGFHLALCPDCRARWLDASGDVPADDLLPLLLAEPTAHPEPLLPDSHDTNEHFPGHVFAQDGSQNGATAGYQESAQPPVSVSHGYVSFAEHLAAETITASPSQSSAPEGRRNVTYRSLLRQPNFRRLWIGQAISTFGSLFTRVAVPVYVFNLTQSYAQLGFAFFSSLVASLVFGLFAGALVDRWDYRRTIISADLANAVVMLGLMLCALLPLPLPLQLAGLYLANFAAALLREIFNPARIALFASVLSDDELLAANALDEATTNFGELVSFPLAALILSFLGPQLAFGIDALTFLLSALVLLRLRAPANVRIAGASSSILREIREGVNVVRQRPAVLKIVLLSLVIPLLFSLHITLQLPYTVEVLKSSESVGYPAIGAAEALGLFLGMLLVGRWGQSVSRAVLLAVGIIGYGLATFMQGIAPQIATALGLLPDAAAGTLSLFVLAATLVLLGGAANSLILVSIRTVLQEATPRAVLGRVYSVKSMASGIGFACGALLTGIGQGRPATVIAALGGCALALGIVSLWWLPERSAARRYEPPFEPQLDLS